METKSKHTKKVILKILKIILVILSPFVCIFSHFTLPFAGMMSQNAIIALLIILSSIIARILGFITLWKMSSETVKPFIRILIILSVTATALSGELILVIVYFINCFGLILKGK